MRQYLLPLVAASSLAFATVHVIGHQQTPARPGPPAPPPRAPFERALACTGVVEPLSENIAVGSPVEGIVTKVFVQAGQSVDTGAALFQLDDRVLQAELRTRAANLRAAEAQLARLESQPRPEELPPSMARVNEAKANLASLEDRLRRAQALSRSRSVSAEELEQTRESCAAARAQLERTRAEYQLLEAGAWGPDKEVARAAVAYGRAQHRQTETELERLVVRAQVPVRVLQVNVRPGEFIGARPGQALIVLGQVYRMHVRVDIDEHDIPRFQKGASARAIVRGSPGHDLPLEFVRVEPFVVPKQNLAGDTSQRVDTRVLQVIYALPVDTDMLFVGQPLDVFIDTAGAVEPSTQTEGR
jgi:multidrug resistance efflux pump